MDLARRYVSILDWLPAYRRADLPGDLLAGLIVAIMLVPQAMAYALLAGLPPQIGLYASILPVVLYALFGSSRVLAVGPVAMVSLMVASGLGGIAEPGSAEYYLGALLLALMSGAILLVMGLVKLGFIVNFLSHPVISGFTSAAALVIGFSQLKHLLGLEIPRSHLITDIVGYAATHIAEVNLATLGLGLGSVALLLLSRGALGALLRRLHVAEAVVGPLTKTGPLFVVIVGTVLVWQLGLRDQAGVKIVGDIPAGLPPIALPAIDVAYMRELVPVALLIALVGFMESVSVAKSLASRRRQKIDADQELRALGAANIGAALTGGYPVTGGFSRSVVNFTAGANTALASVVTAALIALTVAFLTPLFYNLPKAVLASIIVVAVANLVDLRTLVHVWRYSKADAASLLATFAAVLALGIEIGILAGAGLSVLLYLWRTSRPHMAEVGRVGSTEHFRNIKRHTVTTWPNLLAIRVDESLYFANTKFLEDRLRAALANRPTLEHLVLIFSAVNFVDASALETLDALIEEFREVGVTVHLAEVKGPVMDRLEHSDLIDHLGEGQIFLSTHEAVEALARPS